MTRLQRVTVAVAVTLALSASGAGTAVVQRGVSLAHAPPVELIPSGPLPKLSPFQEEGLALSSDIIGIADPSGPNAFHRAIDVAQRVTRGQADILGLPWRAPVPLQGFAEPSLALEELVTRAGISLTRQQQNSIRALDAVPDPLHRALTRFVDAFLALDTAARVDVDVAALAAVEKHLAELSGVTGSISDDPALQWPSSVHVDLSPVFPARVQFLEAIQELQDAVVAAGPLSSLGCDIIGVPMAFSVDLAGCDNTYTDFYLLQFDVGGNDRYYNNAGGSNIWGGYFCGLPLPGGRAALVDFGGGSDLYGYPPLPLRCGVNGGASMAGMGFLLDDGGDDTYLAEFIGTNGGADLFGSGFLLDVSGRDAYYTRSGNGVNGGGLEGVGTLVDTGGDDVFLAGGSGANGGGQGFLYTTGLGLLVDTEGNDAYLSSIAGANGGGADSGFGFLLDLRGDDLYSATHMGTNGGGSFAGEGFLLDVMGNDRYVSAIRGTNGGGSALGRGFLADLGGNDDYMGEAYGNNGGADPNGWGIEFVGAATGFLFDASGHDHYFDSVVDCFDCIMVPKGPLGAQVDSGV